jgi:hypothetical protein
LATGGGSVTGQRRSAFANSGHGPESPALNIFNSFH